MKRVRASCAMQSHWSPLSWSAGSLGSQFFCFFFDEGPLLVELSLFDIQVSYSLVVELVGVQPQPKGHRGDALLGCARQTGRLANAAAVLKMAGNRLGPVWRHPTAPKGGALPL